MADTDCGQALEKTPKLLAAFDFIAGFICPDFYRCFTAKLKMAQLTVTFLTHRNGAAALIGLRKVGKRTSAVHCYLGDPRRDTSA